MHPATGKVLIPLGAGGISASAGGRATQAARAVPAMLAAQAPGEGLACGKSRFCRVNPGVATKVNPILSKSLICSKSRV